MSSVCKSLAVAFGTVGLLFAPGCGQVTGLLSPEFVSALGFGDRAATLPGDAPALLVAVENRTAYLVEAFVSYRVESDVVQSYTTVAQAGETTATALVCPVREITLGDVSDLTRVGAVVRFGLGNVEDPFIEVDAFGVLLKEEINYNCGDRITFVIQPSAAALSGYQIFAFIQRAEAP